MSFPRRALGSDSHVSEAHAQPAASIGLPVVGLQVMLQGPFEPAACRPNPTNQSSLNDRRSRIPSAVCNSHIDKSGIDDHEANGKSKKKKNLSCVGKQDDIIPETNFDSYFVRSL
jgi:hypothetical protein